MTPERKAVFEALVDALLTATCAPERCWNEETDAAYAQARAALLAFTERLTAGEEVVRVVNPKYPDHKHYWAANSHLAFPASYVLTPGTFHVTPLDGGTDGD